MKIVSFNIKINQQNPKQNIDKLISDTQADIYCFQEISKEILSYLKSLHQFQIYYEKEFSKTNSDGIETCSYVVTLSKLVIQNTGKVHVIEPTKPITKLSKKLQRFSKMFEDYTAEYATYIDVKRLSDHKQFRIFNTHLKRFTTPQNRINQFKKLIHQMSRTKENIICGDLNILDSFLGKLSGKFFNSTLKDNFKYNERKELDNILIIHKIKNPFSKMITFDNRFFFNLQLDHILIPDHTELIEKKVLNIKKYGSDHAPIMLEIK